MQLKECLERRGDLFVKKIHRGGRLIVPSMDIAVRYLIRTHIFGPEKRFWQRSERFPKALGEIL